METCGRRLRRGQETRAEREVAIGIESLTLKDSQRLTKLPSAIFRHVVR
jgi:hypothetical protein